MFIYTNISIIPRFINKKSQVSLIINELIIDLINTRSLSELSNRSQVDL